MTIPAETTWTPPPSRSFTSRSTEFALCTPTPSRVPQRHSSPAPVPSQVAQTPLPSGAPCRGERRRRRRARRSRAQGGRRARAPGRSRERPRWCRRLRAGEERRRGSWARAWVRCCCSWRWDTRGATARSLRTATGKRCRPLNGARQALGVQATRTLATHQSRAGRSTVPGATQLCPGGGGDSLRAISLGFPHL